MLSAIQPVFEDVFSFNTIFKLMSKTYNKMPSFSITDEIWSRLARNCILNYIIAKLFKLIKKIEKFEIVQKITFSNYHVQKAYFQTCQKCY